MKKNMFLNGSFKYLFFKEEKLVEAWIAIHQEEIESLWVLIHEQGSYFKIDPLK